MLDDTQRAHYAEVHWNNDDKRSRSDKQVAEWHDQEHNEDKWFFKPDHEHAVTVKESKRKR